MKLGAWGDTPRLHAMRAQLSNSSVSPPPQNPTTQVAVRQLVAPKPKRSQGAVSKPTLHLPKDSITQIALQRLAAPEPKQSIPQAASKARATPKPPSPQPKSPLTQGALQQLAAQKPISPPPPPPQEGATPSDRTVEFVNTWLGECHAPRPKRPGTPRPFGPAKHFPPK